jgi:signal transduction histidine kinase
VAAGVQVGMVDGPAPGELAELLGAFNDVTGRLQRTHERLQREVAGLKRELREANEQLSRSRRLAALGEMAAGIAHEVRNPLSSIRLYARMLEQDLADRPDQRSIAGRIGAAVHGLDAVVGDVLNFARELRVRPGRRSTLAPVRRGPRGSSARKMKASESPATLLLRTRPW